MPTWTPWSSEDEDLGAPSVTVVETVTPALTEQEARDLLQAKLADVLDPPTLDEAYARFAVFIGPNVSIRDALASVRKFCKRVTKSG